MVRNSTKYVSYKDLKAVCHDLKQKYTALNESTGEAHWDDLNEFFAYPEDIRRVIYTTNAIE
mgnify:CR=1 FL=1